jgi:hypothetical protein
VAERSKGGSRPATSKGALLDDGGITRGTLKALPLSYARACTKATARRKPRQCNERVDGLGARANEAKGQTFTQRACVRGCTGTLVGIRAHACACRGHGHGGSRDDDGDTAAQTAITQKKQRMENKRGCTCGDDSSDTCKNFPSLARWPSSPAACVAARWWKRCFPSARRAGRPQMSGETVLTLVAPSRSEGVGEEKRRGSSVWKKTVTA